MSNSLKEQNRKTTLQSMTDLLVEKIRRGGTVSRDDLEAQFTDAEIARHWRTASRTATRRLRDAGLTPDFV
ncbi:MAG: hypothetical protein Alpg2KO_14350 [Alphaproteobacteria bacterium]